jgi:hypothetical protein
VFFNKAGVSSWRNFLADAGFNPYAQYRVIVHQHHINGATSYDRMISIYRRTWNGYGHVLSIPFNDGSSWKWAQPVLRTALAVIAMAGGQAWLSAEIGAAVMGSYATTYPALTSAIGNIAIATATNGGDIESAVQNAVMAYAGGAVGGLVTTATDSATIGRIAASATNAALTGGDVREAVAVSLVRAGAQSIGTLLEERNQTMNFADDNFTFNDALLSPPDYFAGGTITPGFGSPADLVTFDSGADYSNEGRNYSVPSLFSNDTGLIDIGAQIPVYTDVPAIPGYGNSGGGVTNTNWVSDLTNLALAAIRVNAAYQQSQAPIRTVSSTPDGRTQTPNADGTLTVRDSSGRIVGTTRPNTGTPYVLPDGRTIINNGNGTFTTIMPNGSSTTGNYGSAGGGSSGGGTDNTLLYLGAAAVALLALK